jgi:hypothetical protein
VPPTLKEAYVTERKKEAYVRNNPLRYFNPSGLDYLAIAQDGTAASDEGEYTEDQCGNFNKLRNGAEYFYVAGRVDSAYLNNDGTYQLNFTTSPGDTLLTETTTHPTGHFRTRT